MRILAILIFFGTRDGWTSSANDISLGQTNDDSVGDWSVKEGAVTCIRMSGSVSFQLTYLSSDFHKLQGPVTIKIPSNATTESSNCEGRFYNGSRVQTLVLNFWTDWAAEFHFTQDKNLETPDQASFSLFQVVLRAALTPKLFPNAADKRVTYEKKVYRNGTGALWEVMYAEAEHSLICPSEQNFLVVDGLNGTARLIVRRLKVQAFVTTADWYTAETCDQDKTNNDLVAVVVGSVLAALVLTTLIAYLLCRCRSSTPTSDQSQDHSHHQLPPPKSELPSVL